MELHKLEALKDRLKSEIELWEKSVLTSYEAFNPEDEDSESPFTTKLPQTLNHIATLKRILLLVEEKIDIWRRRR